MINGLANVRLWPKADIAKGGRFGFPDDRFRPVADIPCGTLRRIRL